MDGFGAGVRDRGDDNSDNKDDDPHKEEDNSVNDRECERLFAWLAQTTGSKSADYDCADGESHQDAES